MNKAVGLFFATLAGVLIVGFSYVFAQENTAQGGVALNLEITDSAAGVGDIISVAGDNFKRSDAAYDDKVYGVVVEAPILSVRPKADNTKAVITSGQASVKVTNSGGNITSGDIIATSSNAGVGQKATQAGFVLGKALANWESADVGQIPVEVQIGYSQIGESAAQGGTLQSIISDPGRLRLLLAVVLAIFVLLGGVFAFARLVNTGVAAIGRNPLARAAITRGMIVSGSVVVVIMLAGFGVAIALVMLGSQ